MSARPDPVGGYQDFLAPVGNVALVLEGYARLGGRLLGACRWEQNPLMLTHVRWETPQGQPHDALRRPGEDAPLSAEERDVWVQLALGYPASTSGPIGPGAPWQPLAISPQQAAYLAAQLSRRRPSGPLSRDPQAAATAHVPSSGVPHGLPPLPASGSNPSAPSPSSAAPSGDGRHPTGSISGAHTQIWRSAAPRLSPLSGAAGEAQHGWAGALSPAPTGDAGVAVIPCVEIALAMAVTGPSVSDHTRDFARDVALTFRRAATTLPPVREIRGWMRGDRLVLGARMVVAPGARPATPSEMEGAARLLADALTRFTLPYARMSYAAPGEWAQGRPLPE